MRDFDFYGDTTEKFPFSGKEMQQYKEQIKRIRSNHRLTVLTFVLLVLTILETMAFIALQLLLKSSENAGLIGVILEVITFIVVAATVHGYRKMSIDLRSVDLAVLIIAELLFGFSEFMMYVYKQPFYMYVIAGISFVLILYILLFVKAKIKERVTFAALPLVMLVAAGFLSINTSIFTVRYVYLSSDGYYNDVSSNDITHFYYTDPVNASAFNKIPLNAQNGIYNMAEYERFCDSYKSTVNMKEVLNFSRTYNDSFFNNNCLYVAAIDLESPSDRVDFCGLSYVISSQIPCVHYQKDTDGKDAKSVCLMLIEVPLKDDEKINNIVEFKTDSVIISK
ncbi:hypothetical protein DXC23_04925 [Eubacterium sp. OM08-24]|jgi:hypothetical protein|uniref:hypothetical protein n=1 Tax=Eubacterium sp. OM08-24 TaxID=2292352 RepID=UPI000E44F5DB|nr:hypothetical protein [Eubacterium sp. OM08-24]RGM22386.1 hypothetical protein DXC23_04925 [Eubacterium sp. OM08-24]